MAEGMNAHAGKVVGAVDDVAASHVALVQENLSAEIAYQAGTRMNGDERRLAHRLQIRPVASPQLDDGEVAVGVHFVAGGIGEKLWELRARKLTNRSHASGQGEIADEHVDAVIQVAIDAVNELVIFDGK